MYVHAWVVVEVEVERDLGALASQYSTVHGSVGGTQFPDARKEMAPYGLSYQQYTTGV